MTNPTELLKEAARLGDANGIREAIKAGADFKTNSFNLVYDALNYYLTYESSGEALIALHEQGVDMNAVSPNHKGKSAFHVLIDDTHGIVDFGFYNRAEFAQPFYDVFKKVGFDWNQKDINGNTPILTAGTWLLAADLKEIEKAGGRLNEANNAGETLAHIISSRENIDFHTWPPKPERSQLQQFVDSGIDFSAKDHRGNTPFHSWVIHGNFANSLDERDGDEDKIRSFHDLGIDLHALNHDGKEATDLLHDDIGRGIPESIIRSLTSSLEDNNLAVIVERLQPKRSTAPTPQVHGTGGTPAPTAPLASDGREVGG
jgi:hypothetical protein